MSFFFRSLNRSAKLLLIISLGACVMTRIAPPPEKPEADWLESALTPAKGVVVLVHGLNNNPQTLRPIADELRKAGYHCALVGLSGHRGEGWSLTAYSAAWKNDVRR